MKAPTLINRDTKKFSPRAFLLAIFIVLSPVLAWASPSIEGGDKSMTAPLEVSASDFEEELSIEEWMTQPFELGASGFETELNIEEWMTQPFDRGFSDFEEELVIEDWMIQPF